MRLYKGFASTPVFQTAEGAFTVELPNRNEMRDTGRNLAEETSSVTGTASRSQRDKDMVFALAKEKGTVTRKEVEEACGVGSTKAYKLLKALCEDGLLVQMKQGNQTVYICV